MRREKALIVIVLVFSLLVTMAACKSNTENAGEGQTSESKMEGDSTQAVTTKSESNDPKEVEWMLVQYGPYNYTNHLKIYQMYEEVGNMKLKILPVPIDAYVEKLNIYLASNQIPDIVTSYNESSFSNFKVIQILGPKGVFVPISDHYDKIPNLKNYFDKYPDAMKYLVASDGKVYHMPIVWEPGYDTYGLVMRTDLLAEKNINPEDIKTIDDLFNAFMVLKEANNGKPVVGARFGLNRIGMFAKMFGISFKIDESYSVLNDKYINQFETKNCKDAVAFLAKMYDEGILHPEWVSMSDKQWSEAMMGSDLAAFVDNMQNIGGFQGALRETIPDAELTAVIPPKYEGKMYAWGKASNFAVDWAHVINSETKALDEILKAWNWAYDMDNHEKIIYGEEGVSFERREDGTPEWKYDTSTDKGRQFYFEEWGGRTNRNWLRIFTEAEIFSYVYFGLDGNPGKPHIINYNEKVYTYVTPNLMLTDEENESIKSKLVTLETFVEENIVKFIYGEISIGEWDEFLEQLEDLGINDVIKVYNTAYERMK